MQRKHCVSRDHCEKTNQMRDLDLEMRALDQTKGQRQIQVEIQRYPGENTP